MIFIKYVPYYLGKLILRIITYPAARITMKIIKISLWIKDLSLVDYICPDCKEKLKTYAPILKKEMDKCWHCLLKNLRFLSVCFGLQPTKFFDVGGMLCT